MIRSSRDARLAACAALLLALVAPIALYLALHGADSPGAPATRAAGLRANRLPQDLEGARAPRFDLADARGGRLTGAGLRGRPYLVTFLYTRCPDVCPLIGDEIRVALDKLGPTAGRVAAVAVSVDPAHDSAAAVREWLGQHREPPNFHYLIGDERDLRPLWRAYYAAPQIPGDPRSSHTASIWLVDARGRLRGKYSAGAPVSPSDIAGDLETLLAKEPR